MLMKPFWTLGVKVKPIDPESRAPTLPSLSETHVRAHECPHWPRVISCECTCICASVSRVASPHTSNFWPSGQQMVSIATGCMMFVCFSFNVCGWGGSVHLCTRVRPPAPTPPSWLTSGQRPSGVTSAKTRSQFHTRQRTNAQGVSFFQPALLSWRRADVQSVQPLGGLKVESAQKQ